MVIEAKKEDVHTVGDILSMWGRFSLEVGTQWSGLLLLDGASVHMKYVFRMYNR